MQLRDMRLIMEQELELLKEFGTQEELMQTYIHEHNWTGLNETIMKLRPLSEQIDQVEQQRHACFSRLMEHHGMSPEGTFYQLIVHLPRTEREELAELYRELKISVLKIKGITSTVDSYIRTVRDTMNGILENVMPHRKGKLYNQTGTVCAVESEALVVNTRV